jgi:hypothetical protein
MAPQSSSNKRVLILLVPFIVATLVMLPRLASPQFGFFDDARMLAQSEDLLQRDFSMSVDKQAGRFRPGYWLYYTIIYAVAGDRSFWFFIGNLFIFYVLLYQIRLILKNMGSSSKQIVATSLLFILSMPIIENFYTLSKGEPLQLVFILEAVILFSRVKSQNKIAWLRVILATLSILIAILIKETAMVMVPIFFLWAGIDLIFKDPDSRKGPKSQFYLLTSAVIAVAIYFLLRNSWGATALLGGTYTDRYLVDVSSLFQKLLRWLTQLVFYFHYLLPIILIILLLFFFKDSLTHKEKRLIFQWGIWSLLWYGILVPWEYAELYYLLPFGFGVSILIGIITPPTLRSIKAGHKFLRIAIIFLGVAAGVLFTLTLPNYVTDAKTQLTFDRVNQEMLEFAANYASEDSAVYVSIETNNEYIEMLEVYLREHHLLQDITYGNINADLMEEINDQAGAIVLMPFINNQPNLTVRAGVEEFYQQQWNQKFLENTESSRVSLKTFEGSFRLSNVNLPLALCPILGQRGFCEKPDPLIDTRLFTYGWEIFEIR